MAITTCHADKLNQWPTSWLATHPPAKVATSVRAAPMIDASITRPGRILYMYRPMNRAIGIVQAMVNVPHEEPGTRRTAPAGMGMITGPFGCSSVPPLLNQRGVGE